jgi:hypothetical protein
LSIACFCVDSNQASILGKQIRVEFTSELEVGIVNELKNDDGFERYECEWWSIQ